MILLLNGYAFCEILDDVVVKASIETNCLRLRNLLRSTKVQATLSKIINTIDEIYF